MNDVVQYPHLSPQANIVIHLPNVERINYIHRDKWINHDLGSQIRNKIKSSLFLPHNNQALCMLIIGVGGAGKSSLLERISSDCSNWAQRNASPPPHIELKLSAEPTLANNINSICDQHGITVPNFRKDTLPIQLVLLLKARRIKLLLIDEFNHLLAVNRSEQRKNLNFFKNLSGPPTSLHIVACGTHEALHAVNMDIQLSSRFQVMELHQWTANEEFRAFLASYERVLPLRLPSNLASKEFVNFFSSKTDSTTRNIVNRLKWAAMATIIEGKEKIEIESLEKASSLPDLLSIYEGE